jgi:hypothetical protein
VFPARYGLNSYIVFRKRLVSKRLNDARSLCVSSPWSWQCPSGVRAPLRIQIFRAVVFESALVCWIWASDVFLFLSVASWPPLWSTGQSSWLQIQRYGFDYRRYQIFWEVVGLERGQLSILSTIEELLERKSGGSGLENREYGRRDTSRWQRGTVYPRKLALTSPTDGGRSVGVVRSRTQATEFFFKCCMLLRLLYWLFRVPSIATGMFIY